MSKAPAEIRSLARSHTETAIKTLVSIMNQKKAPAAARVQAANSLMDRGWGKAPQELHLADGTPLIEIKFVGGDNIKTIEHEPAKLTDDRDT